MRGGLLRGLRLHPAVRAALLAETAYQLWQYWNHGEPGWSIEGYEHYADCAALPTNWWAIGSNFCASLQAGGVPLTTPLGPSPPYIHLANRNNGPIYRWRTTEIWKQVGTPGDPLLPEYGTGQQVGYLHPVRAPNVLPDLWPPGTPLEPDPQPWRRSARRYDRDTYQGHSREPAVRRRGVLRLYEVPSYNLVGEIVGLSGDRSLVTSSEEPRGKHALRPPRRDERERKFQDKKDILRVALARWGMAPTEWVDLIDALYAALPKEIRSLDRNHGTVYRRARAVWENLDRLDVPSAVRNVVLNEIEDRIIGRILGKLNRRGAEIFGAERHATYRGATGLSRNFLGGLVK